MAAPHCCFAWVAEISIDDSAAMKAVKAMDRNCLVISGNSETTSSLQSGYCDFQIGPFEPRHRLIGNMAVVGMGPGGSYFFQNMPARRRPREGTAGAQSLLPPIQKWPDSKVIREIKSALRLSHQFLLRKSWKIWAANANGIADGTGGFPKGKPPSDARRPRRSPSRKLSPPQARNASGVHLSNRLVLSACASSPETWVTERT